MDGNATLIADFLPIFWRILLVILPFILLKTAWEKWVSYIRKNYINGLKWTLLEIKTPQNVDRSPEAMELFLNSLYQTGGTSTWTALWWSGKVRPWFSLEIVSIEGNVYFFIYCEKRFKDYIASQIYAFYPEAEVSEVDDYTRYVPPFNKGSGWKMHGFEFALNKDKVEALPIKTYKEFELDKQIGLDDNQKFDPISSTVEFLASLKPGEQVWIQIIIRAAAARHAVKDEQWKTQGWDKTSEAQMLKYEKDIQDKYKKAFDNIKTEDRFVKSMSSAELRIYESMQRNVSKNQFDFGIRALYLAQDDKFNGNNVMPMSALFKLYSTALTNNIAITFDTSKDYDWDNFFGLKVQAMKEEMFKAYVRRSYFYWPHDEDTSEAARRQGVMSTEELATLFHFPGKEVSAPSFERVTAKKAEPPSNLPLG